MKVFVAEKSKKIRIKLRSQLNLILNFLGDLKFFLEYLESLAH